MVDFAEITENLKDDFPLCSVTNDVQRTASSLIEEVDSFLSDFFSADHSYIVKTSSRSNLWVDHALPFLFSEAFPDIGVQDLKTVGVGLGVYREFLVTQDWLIDQHVPQKTVPWAVLRSGMILEKALAVWEKLFEPESLFWDHYRTYQKEQMAAILKRSIRHRNQIVAFSTNEMEAFIKGQTALRKLAAAALGVLSHAPEKLKAVEVALDNFAIANQLGDDLRDWEEDYLIGDYSFILTKLIMDCGLQEEVLRDPPLSAKRIGQHLFFTDACDTTLEMIERYYGRASEAVEPFGCRRWMELIRILRKEYQALRGDLGEAKEKELARVGTHEKE